MELEGKNSRFGQVHPQTSKETSTDSNRVKKEGEGTDELPKRPTATIPSGNQAKDQTDLTKENGEAKK